MSRDQRAVDVSSDEDPVEGTVDAAAEEPTIHPADDQVVEVPDTAEAEEPDAEAEEAEAAEDADTDKDEDNADSDAATAAPKRRIDGMRLLAFGVLPGLALVLAMVAGFLKWQDSSVRNAEVARIESVQAAKDSTIALLSYRPDTVDRDLAAAQDRLTGTFRDSYTQLTNDVVIPGAKQQQISAVATVPAVASVSADSNRAVALVFVDQTVIVGGDAPTNTASSVRVTLEKDGDRWLISGFDPV